MSQTLKQILDKLSDSERRTLLYAFEHGLPQHVPLPDGRFIGVNVPKQSHAFEIQQEAGLWSAGILRETEQ